LSMMGLGRCLCRRRNGWSFWFLWNKLHTNGIN